MAADEKTGSSIATIASKGLKDPGSLSKKDIQKLAASALTQAPDKETRAAKIIRKMAPTPKKKK